MRHHEMMIQKMKNNPKIKDDSGRSYYATSDKEADRLEAEKAKLSGDSNQNFLAKSLAAAEEIRGPKSKMTVEGGIAVKMVNNTGAVSSKGYIVCADENTDFAVILATQDKSNPIGVFYEGGVPNGEEAWVVVNGIADVYFSGGVTRGQWARGFITSDTDYVSGQAIAQDVEVIPADDRDFPIYYGDVDVFKYFKIGYALESRSSPGLARCILHFN